MNDDLIRRSDVLKVLRLYGWTPIDGLYDTFAHDIPSADRPQWVPCPERLPEENEEVLVCDKDGTMEVCDLEMFGRGIGLKWTDKNGYECWLDIVAWMPLPEPWKGADDDRI